MIRPQDDPRGLYTRHMRENHVEQFITAMMALGPAAFEATQSRHVGPTFGLSPEYVREVKARFRNELSFSGDGK